MHVNNVKIDNYLTLVVQQYISYLKYIYQIFNRISWKNQTIIEILLYNIKISYFY